MYPFNGIPGYFCPKCGMTDQIFKSESATYIDANGNMKNVFADDLPLAFKCEHKENHNGKSFFWTELDVDKQMRNPYYGNS